ncbi:polyprenyl synthetase family protein [Nocardia sp. NPDC051463]|uniref:polyprenyl synthetase family protein n=1 Tax=Nocardia sp. NPDC051463 TaxID=3154845 RepID=UPI003446F64B
MHLGSLYHDDVIDHADQLRGRPSANAVWGPHLAVLGGDCVTSSGVRTLLELGQCEGWDRSPRVRTGRYPTR